MCNVYTDFENVIIDEISCQVQCVSDTYLKVFINKKYHFG